MGHINYQLSTWDISIINPKMTQVIMSHGPMPRKDDRSAEEDTLKAAAPSDAKWWPVMTTEPWAMENGP